MQKLSEKTVRYLRLEAQHLRKQEKITAAQIVQALCGLQAQELTSAILGVRARTSGLLATDVERERTIERSFVRTWGPRGTLHLLPGPDFGWLLSLFGPVFLAANRTRRLELGLTEEICHLGSRLISRILTAHNSLTRAEIVTQLKAHGLPLEGQAVPHLLGYCALSGIICYGAEREREPEYVLLDDWLPGWRSSTLTVEAAYKELTLRYLAAYGPATPADMARWSGLPLPEIKAAWKEIVAQLTEYESEGGQSLWLLKTEEEKLELLRTTLPEIPPFSVRLLPRYDTCLLGHQSRDFILPPAYAKRVNAGGGIIHPTLVVDGEVRGTWKSKKQKNGLAIELDLFENFSEEWRAGVEAEVKDTGRFLGVEAFFTLPSRG